MCSYSGDWQQELRKFFAFVADEEHWLEELRRSLCASEHFDVFEHFVILDKDGKGFLNPEDFVDFLQRYDPDICDKCGSNNIFYRFDTDNDRRVSPQEFLEAVVCNDPNLRWLVEQRCCYSSSCVCPCPEESAAIATLLLREVELEEALETWRQRIFCLLGGAAGLYKAFRYFDVRVEGVITSGGLISLFSRHTGTEVTSRDVRGLFHRFDRRRTPSGKRPRDGGRLTLEDFLAALLPAETDREAALQEVASAQAREKMKGMRGRGGGGANGAGGPDVLLVDTEAFRNRFNWGFTPPLPNLTTRVTNGWGGGFRRDRNKPRDRATREDALIQSMRQATEVGATMTGLTGTNRGRSRAPSRNPCAPPPYNSCPKGPFPPSPWVRMRSRQRPSAAPSSFKKSRSTADLNSAFPPRRDAWAHWRTSRESPPRSPRVRPCCPEEPPDPPDPPLFLPPPKPPKCSPPKCCCPPPPPRCREPCPPDPCCPVHGHKPRCKPPPCQPPPCQPPPCSPPPPCQPPPCSPRPPCQPPPCQPPPCAKPKSCSPTPAPCPRHKPSCRTPCPPPTCPPPCAPTPKCQQPERQPSRCTSRAPSASCHVPIVRTKSDASILSRARTKNSTHRIIPRNPPCPKHSTTGCQASPSIAPPCTEDPAPSCAVHSRGVGPSMRRSKSRQGTRFLDEVSCAGGEPQPSCSAAVQCTLAAKQRPTEQLPRCMTPRSRQCSSYKSQRSCPVSSIADDADDDGGGCTETPECPAHPSRQHSCHHCQPNCPVHSPPKCPVETPPCPPPCPPPCTPPCPPPPCPPPPPKHKCTISRESVRRLHILCPICNKCVCQHEDQKCPECNKGKPCQPSPCSQALGLACGPPPLCAMHEEERRRKEGRNGCAMKRREPDPPQCECGRCGVSSNTGGCAFG